MIYWVVSISNMTLLILTKTTTPYNLECVGHDTMTQNCILMHIKGKVNIVMKCDV